MTPEETRVLAKAVGEMLEKEQDERLEHTKAAMKAAASRPMLF